MSSCLLFFLHECFGCKLHFIFARHTVYLSCFILDLLFWNCFLCCSFYFHIFFCLCYVCAASAHVGIKSVVVQNFAGLSIQRPHHCLALILTITSVLFPGKLPLANTQLTSLKFSKWYIKARIHFAAVATVVRCFLVSLIFLSLLFWYSSQDSPIHTSRVGIVAVANQCPVNFFFALHQHSIDNVACRYFSVLRLYQ